MFYTVSQHVNGEVVKASVSGVLYLREAPQSLINEIKMPFRKLEMPSVMLKSPFNIVLSHCHIVAPMRNIVSARAEGRTGVIPKLKLTYINILY